MNELTVFNNEEFGSGIGTATLDGMPYFVGKDLVENLGYDLSGKHTASEYIRKFCDEEDYIFYDKTHPHFTGEFDYKLLGQRGGYLVNESGMYALILSSKLPSARKFKHWVTNEVLPAIRQTGGYIPITEEDDDEAFLARALIVAQKTLEKRNKQLKEVKEEKEKLESALDKFLSTKGLYDMGQFIKTLDIKNFGRNKMFTWLREHKYLRSNNEPYQQYMDYFAVKNVAKGENVYSKTLLKPQGVKYFYNKLAEEFAINKRLEEVAEDMRATE